MSWLSSTKGAIQANHPFPSRDCHCHHYVSERPPSVEPPDVHCEHEMRRLVCDVLFGHSSTNIATNGCRSLSGFVYPIPWPNIFGSVCIVSLVRAATGSFRDPHQCYRLCKYGEKRNADSAHLQSCCISPTISSFSVLSSLT